MQLKTKNIFLSMVLVFVASLSGVYFWKNSTKPKISTEDAIATALLNIEKTDDGFLVNQPQYTSVFNRDGFTFTSAKGATFGYKFDFVGAQSFKTSLPFAVDTPIQSAANVVDYKRSPDLTERYVVKNKTVDQLFILHQALALKGEDLRVSGIINTTDTFTIYGDGFVCQNETGEVYWNKIKVFDAKGNSLTARFEVTENRINIVVDGKALQMASYPVTIDSEVQSNDFRITITGTDGDGLPVLQSRVAYGDFFGNYLVVYSWGSSGHVHVFGQLVDSDGSLLGDAFQISNSASGNDLSPDAVYNTNENEYLVVWVNDTVGEVYGQRLDPQGNAIGTDDFQISEMGEGTKDNYNAQQVSVSYATSLYYLVVWSGDDNTGSLADDEFEIFGQLIDVDGREIGNNDFRISDMGTDGNANYDAFNPDVVSCVNCTASSQGFFVVWSGDDNTGSLADDEFEIFGQLIDQNGNEVGVNDVRISNMGDDGNADYDAVFPSVASDISRLGEAQFFVVWSADDNTGSLVDDEFEIFGQLGKVDDISFENFETKNNNFRISNMGNDGDAAYDALQPFICKSLGDEYLVVWSGDDNTGSLVDDEFEIFGQFFNPYGIEIGHNDFRISYMGHDGDTYYAANSPSVSCGQYALKSNYFIVWHGDDNTVPLIDGEDEVFGRIYPTHFCGDGVIDDEDELCDDGDQNSDSLPDACRTTCVPAFCGDEVIDSGEECDDGNTVDDDSCSNACEAQNLP